MSFPSLQSRLVNKIRVTHNYMSGNDCTFVLLESEFSGRMRLCLSMSILTPVLRILLGQGRKVSNVSMDRS